jgi:undecaprenyl diphosphate synthase
MVLTVAFDYGSRAELVHAAEQARAAGDTVSEASIAQHLYLADLPPVDVLVRTSGELRISNFMLWQIAGARVYFTERTWPEFDAAELDAALALLDA